MLYANGGRRQSDVWAAKLLYKLHTGSEADIHRAYLLDRAPDAQLPVVVFAPALEPTPHHDGARVRVPQGNSSGSDACKSTKG